MTSSPQPPPGLTVGGYTLLSRLGEGGMGVVHLARRPGGPRVALKVLRPHIVGDEEARQRLAREVGSLRRIRSPWVAEIVDADPFGDIPYVATRYVPGLSLHELVQQEGPLDPDDLWHVALGLAEGIDTVHAVGVLHRDVKPSNVLMEGRNPILIDFGLARVADDPRITHTGWLLGTPGYLAPEILHGDDADAASDLHSWAATVAYAGTGRPPFGRGPSMAIMDRVRRGQFDLDGLPEDLAEVLAACLDPDPAERPDLPALLPWLRDPDAEHPLDLLDDSRGAVPVTERHDVADDHTVPLALATRAHERTVVLPGRGAERVPEAPDATRRYDEDHPYVEDGAFSETWGEPPPAEPPVTPVPVVVRLRRGVLLVGLGVVAAAALTAYPYVALAVLLVVTWLLRSASLAASATGDRRRLRGARWYDPAIYLVGAPWHAVRSIPGTLLLALWSVGLALAVGLVCYAASARLEPSLLGCGLVFAAALWFGPGGSRVRSPLGRVVNPLSVVPATWLAALLVLTAAAGLLGYTAADAGVGWEPADGPPFSSR